MTTFTLVSQLFSPSSLSPLWFLLSAPSLSLRQTMIPLERVSSRLLLALSSAQLSLSLLASLQTSSRRLPQVSLVALPVSSSASSFTVSFSPCSSRAAPSFCGSSSLPPQLQAPTSCSNRKMRWRLTLPSSSVPI